MENGEVTFDGMSSLNEYWNRASETDRLEIKTSSSDDSTDESKFSIKEYRDASCYVNFDEELKEIVDEDESNTVKNLRDNIKLSKSRIKNNLKLQSSRYVRWDVLMSLGLGLWAVLCIVDVLHTQEFMNEGWFVELIIREKKNISKSLVIERPESQNCLLLQFWHYLWRIFRIFSSGAAYILIILVLIVFCGDSRLRKIARHLAIEKNINTKIPSTKNVNKLSTGNKKTPNISEKSSSLRKKLPNSRNVCTNIQKRIPMKLVPSSAIHLHARILSCVEQRLPYLKTLQTRNTIVKKKIDNIPKKLQPVNGNLNKYEKCFTDNRGLLGHLHMTNWKAFKLVNTDRKNAHYIAKTSASVYLMDANTTTYSIQKIHFEVEEYLRKMRKSSKSFNSLRTRIIEARRNSTEQSTNGEIRARIITSSPAFKNFLLRLKHNSCVP